MFSLTDILRKICNHTDLIRNSVSRTDLSGEYSLLFHNLLNREIQFAFTHTTTLVPIEAVLAPFISDNVYEEGIIGDHSSKMKVLMEWIQFCMSRDEKMLIFSQWTSTLDMMEIILNKTDFIYGNVTT